MQEAAFEQGRIGRRRDVRARLEDKRGVYKGMMCSGLGLQWVLVEDADKR
jgi:hypothetical protein